MEKGCGTAFIEMNTPPPHIPHMCIFTYIGIVCLDPLDFFFFFLICIIVHVQAEGGKRIIIL